jgi:hypothetical protein
LALRYFFKLPLMGVEDTGYQWWASGCTSSFGQRFRERSHIKADILQAFIMNPKTLFMSKALGNLVVTVLPASWSSGRSATSVVAQELGALPGST